MPRSAARFTQADARRIIGGKARTLSCQRLALPHAENRSFEGIEVFSRCASRIRLP